MDITTLLFILLGANLLVLILNVVFWLLVSRGDIQVRKKSKQINHEYNLIVSNANQQATEIIDQANQKATKLLEKTEFHLEDMQQQVRKSFQQAVDNQQQSLEKKLADLANQIPDLTNNLQDNFSHQVNDFNQKMNQQLQKQIDKFLEKLNLQTIATAQDTQKQLQTSLRQSLAEVDKYRQEQLTKVEQNIANIIKNVSGDVLHQTLSIEDHQRLITEALERAKKEKIV